MIKSILTAAVLLTSTAAYADVAPLWRNVNGWHIRVDSSIGNGCFLHWVGTRGTTLRLGVANDQDAPNFYILIGDAKWRSLQPSRKYPIAFAIDGRSWTIDAAAIDFNNFPMLGWRVNTEFLAAFMNGRSLTVVYEGTTVASLNLRGSSAALAEVINCQMAMDNKADPFTIKPTTQSDPFARGM